MKKLLSFAILLIIISSSMDAQKTKDVLYLKNGSMIFGKLVEVNETNYKIQTSDGSIFIYPVAEVEKFSKVTPSFNGRKSEGFNYMIETGLLVGSQRTEYSAPFSFNILAGLTLNTKNLLSLGSGVEFFGRPFSPLFLEYRHIITDKKTSPFVFLRAGGVVPMGDDGNDSQSMNYYENGPKDYRGGLSLTIGTGISWVREDYETYLSFAYRYAHTSYVQTEYNRGEVTYENELNRLEIKFGFKF